MKIETQQKLNQMSFAEKATLLTGENRLVTVILTGTPSRFGTPLATGFPTPPFPTAI